MTTFKDIKEKETKILQNLKDWGILDRIAYLTYPDFWNGNEDELIGYQRNFCQRLNTSNKFVYLSMSSHTGKEIDGVPPGGILLAMRIINEHHTSNLIYLWPRKAGGIRIYMIKDGSDGLELSYNYLVYLFDKYLDTIIRGGYTPLKTIDEIVSLQLVDMDVFKTYMQGVESP